MNPLAHLLVFAMAAASPGGGTPASAAAEQPELSSAAADAEVLAFLHPTNQTASRDGEGATGESKRYLKLRNLSVSEAHALARALEAVRMQGNDGGAAAAGLRASLLNLAGAPVEEARAAFREAIKWEERRLESLDWSDTHADAAGRVIPAVDRLLVARRLAAIRGGAVAGATETWVGGYRDVALGLAAFLEGEQFRALEKMQKAADALPEFAPAHAFLGSLYFLFDKKESAVRAWRRALELDPGNDEVRQALAAYGTAQEMHAAKEKTPSAGEQMHTAKDETQEKNEMQETKEKTKAPAKRKMHAGKDGTQPATEKMQATHGAAGSEKTL